MDKRKRKKAMYFDYLSTVSEQVDDGQIQDKDIGVEGGEAAS